MANLVPPFAMQWKSQINTIQYVTHVNSWNWSLKKVLENGKRSWKSPGKVLEFHQLRCVGTLPFYQQKNIHINYMAYSAQFNTPGYKRDTLDLLVALINVSKYMIYPDISQHSLIHPPGNARCLGWFPEFDTVYTASRESPYDKWMEKHHISTVCKVSGQLRENLGPVSISDKTVYRKISWSLEAARFVFRIVRSLWNLTDTSTALLPMCLSNFKAIRQFKVPISWLRDFARSYDNTSFRMLRWAQIIIMVLMPSCLPPLALQVW